MKVRNFFIGTVIIILIINCVHSVYAEDKKKIYSPDGEFVSEMPDGYVFVETSLGYRITNNNAKKGAILELGDYKIQLKTGSSILLLTKKINKDYQAINLRGEADVEIGDKKLTGIGDAYIRAEAFETKDRKLIDIVAARFTSVNGGIYTFSYGMNIIKFNAKAGAKINFNPYEKNVEERRTIEGENTDLILNDAVIIQSNKFSIKFDKNDNIQISLIGEGKFIDNKGNTYSAKDLKIFFGSEDLSAFQGNSISINDKKQEVLLKGEVKLETKNNLKYQGTNKDSYTKFYSNVNFFDILKGDAETDNGKHKISVKNREIKLERKNLDSRKEAESFYVKSRRENKEIQANIIEEKDSFSLFSYENGKLTQTSLIPLSIYEGKLESIPEIQKKYVETLKSVSEELKNSGESQDKIDALELMILNTENINVPVDEKISKLREYLYTERKISLDKETEINAKLRLAELLAERITSPTISKDKSLATNDFNEAKALYYSIQESAKDNKELIEATSLGLADLLRISGNFQDAHNEYDSTFMSTASKEIKSKTRLGVALTELSEKHYARALQELKRALIEDSNNLQAREIQTELRQKILDDLASQNDEIIKQRQQEYKERTGQDESAWSSATSFWNPVFGRNKELWEEYRQIIHQNNDFYEAVQALRTASIEDYDMSIFLLEDRIKMQDIIAESRGFPMVKLSEIEEYLKTKGRNTNELYDDGNLDIDRRYQVVRELKGEKIASLDREYSEIVKEKINSIIRAFDKQPDLRLIASDGFTKDKLTNYLSDYSRPNFYIEFENKDRYEHINQNFYDKAISFFSPKDIAILYATGPASRILGLAGRTMGVEKMSGVLGFASFSEAKITQSALGKTGSFIAKESAKIGVAIGAGKATTDITGSKELGEFIEVLALQGKLGYSETLSAKAKSKLGAGFKGSAKDVAEEVRNFVEGREKIAGNIVYEAHNTANFEKLIQQYKFAQAHGVALEKLDDPKAWTTFYHAYPKGSKPDFSRGLDVTKSSGGFFFTKSSEKSAEALVNKGFNKQDVRTLTIKVSKNIYNPSSKKALIKAAPTLESDAYFVPINRYNKFNELIDKGLIKIE